MEIQKFLRSTEFQCAYVITNPSGLSKTVAAKLSEGDLMALNNLLHNLGYTTVGQFLRDIARRRLDLSSKEVLQRLTSIEEKVNQLSIGRKPSKPATRVQIPATAPL